MSIKPLAELEKTAILEAILETGSMVEAAHALGVSHSTVYNKLARYGLKPKANQIIAELKRQRSIEF